MAGTGPVLLYDGTCGFCAWSVRLVLQHDRRGALRFAALQGDFGAAAVARHEALRGVDSVVWLDQDGGRERALVRSDAALEVARYLGGRWRLALVGRLVPRALRDRLYDLVARHRRRLAGASCLVPTPEQRGRFIP